MISNKIFLNSNVGEFFLRILSRKFATNRVTIAQELSKKFENIPLTEFPLSRTKRFKLSDFKEIDKANQLCNLDRLDENPNYYPSITNILNQTMSPESLAILKRWESEKIKFVLF